MPLHYDMFKGWYHTDTLLLCKEMRQICGEDLDEIAEFVRDKGIGELPKNTKALYSPIGIEVETGDENDLADDVLAPRA